MDMSGHLMGQPFSPSKLPLLVWESVSLSNTWFLGPTRVHIYQNGVSIGTAIFAGLTVVTDRLTDRLCYSVCSNRPNLASAAMQPKNTPVGCRLKTAHLFSNNFIELSSTEFGEQTNQNVYTYSASSTQFSEALLQVRKLTKPRLQARLEPCSINVITLQLTFYDCH